MSKITSSGLHGDNFGQLVLATQGLGGYTLVAHKKILFRLFLEVAPTNVNAVLATITFKSFGSAIRKNILIPAGSLIIETMNPNGPSIGIVFTGDVFPVSGKYEIAFSVRLNTPSTPRFKLNVEFLSPGRLRVLIHNLVGTAPWGTKIEPNLSWLLDMLQSLERFSAMLPVRDGSKLGLTRKDAGLCFSFGENIDPWTCPSGPCTQAENIAKLLKETKEINSAGTLEHVDATIGWRPRDSTMFPPPGGESAGGQAHPSRALASFVGGNVDGIEKTASVMAQEIGHIFGLEPPDSPHSDGGRHSNNRAVVDPFAFDFILLKPYQPPPGSFIGDVMGSGWHQGRDMVLFNAFDWEHLRKKLVQPQDASELIAAKDQPTEKEQKDLVNDFHKYYTGSPEIKVANPAKALSSKKGFGWQWTPVGFQLAGRVKNKKSESGVATSVEGVLSWLEELGIRVVYAPVGDHPLHMVINPNAKTSLPEEGFDISGRTEGEGLTDEEIKSIAARFF